MSLCGSFARVGVCSVIGLVGVLGVVQAQGASKIAVIDTSRVMTDSAQGKAVLSDLDKAQNEKAEELKAINDEFVGMQRRFQEGRLSLAEDKLAELQQELEEKGREFERLREDAERDIQKLRQEEIKKVEDRIFPVITAIGQEFSYTLIFNKFQSGLVYADQQIDITDLVIQRLDATASE